MDQTMMDEPEGPGIGALVSQLPTILWERKWWIIVPAVLGIVAAALAMIFIKPVYEADALMLVESPQVQGSMVEGLGNEVVDRRIARIRAEVISRPALVALIERHRLYPEQRGSAPLSSIIQQMREAISLTPTTAPVPGASNDERTIAFRLAFEYSEPGPAQAVTQDLMDRILELDASGNVEQATNTVQFLTDQATDLESQIAEIEGQIAQISARYGGTLAGVGGAIIGNSGSYDMQISSLQRDNAMLQVQRNELASADQRDPNVRAAEARLAAARATYTESHPDVAAARRQLAEARNLAEQTVQALPTERIDRQIEFNNRQIAMLRQAQAQQEAQVNARLAQQSRAPFVQQQIESLEKDLSGLNSRYQDVQNRLAAARAGVKAEDEQVAERLVVVEPPIVPEEPIWPDRLLITLMCVGGGLALGVFLALAMEMFFRPIRDPDSLAAISGETPLAVVPILTGRSNTRARSWRRFVPGLSRA